MATQAKLGKEDGSARCLRPLVRTEDGSLRVILELRPIVGEKIAKHGRIFRKLFIYDAAELCDETRRLRLVPVQDAEGSVQHDRLLYSAGYQPTIHLRDR